MALRRLGRLILGKRDSSVIRDAVACNAWLASLGRPGSDDALISMTEFVMEGAQDGLALSIQMEILDQVRALVFGELRGRVEHAEFRALPMSATDTASLWILADAVGALSAAYQRLAMRNADPVIGQTADVAAQLSALHRALDLHARLIELYLSLYMQVPIALWDRHCTMGQLVRDFNGQDTVQADFLKASLSTTCREAFVTPFLLALADPAAMSQNEFRVVLVFARKYSAKVGFRIDPVENPTARAAARPVVNPGAVINLGKHQVRFDSQRLRSSLDARIAALDAGQSPAQIGFGEQLSSAASRALLLRLVRLWGPISTDAIDAPEHHWRKPASDRILAILGMPGPRIKSFQRTSVQAAAGVYRYDNHRRDGLTRARQDIEHDRMAELLKHAETWQVSGEVADTLLCARQQPAPKASFNQLVLLKPGVKGSTTPLLVGVVRGLHQSMQPNDEHMLRPVSTHFLRVKLLAGLPIRIGAASEGVDIDCAFLLVSAQSGEAPDLRTEHLWDRVRAAPQQYSLILPLASYRPQRPVRAAAGGAVAALQIEELLQRGLDFDQVSFSIS